MCRSCSIDGNLEDSFELFGKFGLNLSKFTVPCLKIGAPVLPYKPYNLYRYCKYYSTLTVRTFAISDLFIYLSSHRAQSKSVEDCFWWMYPSSNCKSFPRMITCTVLWVLIGTVYTMAGNERTSGETYEGGLKGDKRKGKGRIEFPDGAIYEGQLKDGQMHGHGRIEFPDGFIYEGELNDGKRWQGSVRGFRWCHIRRAMER
jgi:hypothetical protein